MQFHMMTYLASLVRSSEIFLSGVQESILKLPFRLTQIEKREMCEIESTRTSKYKAAYMILVSKKSIFGV